MRTKKEQKILESLIDDKELSQAIQKDIQRFTQQDLAIKKSQEKILKIRDKLTKTVNKNKQVLEWRQKLQKGSWKKIILPLKRLTGILNLRILKN